MLKNKILFKLTGSIACYKACYVISKLVQNNFEVKTVCTPSALQFIGRATLEGLTHNPVYADMFENKTALKHIDLIKWADLAIVCPATANVINKFARGIADDCVTTLFLANNFKKPYLITPAMNVNMWQHPATQASLKTLEKWGIKILPTEKGTLACGDKGAGRLLDPDKIYEKIRQELK